MQTDWLIIVTVLIIGFLSIIYLLNKKLSNIQNKSDDALVEWLKSMQNSINSTNKNMTDTTSSVVKTLQEN